MKKIKIEWLSDSMDCDTCGPSYAEGARVTIDDKPFGDFKPFAHCYSGSNFEPSDVYEAIIGELGGIVSVEYVGEED